MGATYTRQSSYSDGDTITAAHTNDEFNQLLAAFASSSGHTHDGTTAEGGPITKLLGNTLTFGAGTAGTDITMTFDGESNDGVLKWMEDEDYFEFSDDILVASTEKLQFRDTAIYLNSSTDGQLDIVADTEIQIAATTIDINGNVDISGTVTIGSAEISETELEVLDGLTVSTTEVNILDGDTTASSTTLADADRVVVNDAGTMKQVALTDFETYFESALDTLSNVTTVGALNSGSITSGFGNIDTGSSTITTTGLITGGSLDIDDVVINGSTIGHTDDTDLITVANGIATVAGEISVTTLDIGGTNVSATATELNIMDGDTSATSTTLADADRVVVNDAGTMKQVALTDFETYFESALDTLSNVTSLGTLTTLTVDNVIINGSTIGHTGDTDLMTVASGVLTVAGEVDAVSLDVSGGIDVDGTTDLDNTDIDGTLVVDGSNISLDSTSTLNIDNSNTSNGITIGTATSGVPVSIGHTTSEVTVNDNLTVTGDLTVSGTTTTVNSTTVNLNDHNIVLDTGNTTSAVINGAGITIEGGSGDDATFSYNTTGPKFELKLGSSHESLQLDQLIAASLDVSGDIDIDGTANLDVVDIDGAVDMASTLTVAGVVDITDTTDSSDATGDTGALRVEGGASIAKKLFVGTDADIDGTLEADAITVNGTALNTVIAGVTVTNATTAAVATTVTISDNESTNEDNAIIFTAGGDVDGGNIGLESDGDLTYNPSTGRLTATQLSGTLQTAAQTNVTTLGTLTALTTSGKPVHDAGISVKNGSTSAGFVEFFEDSDNGTNKVTLIGPSSTADITLTLPSTAGTVATTAVASDDATALAIALG